MDKKSIDISELEKRFHDGVIICSRGYADLRQVSILCHYACYGGVSESEILKVEDDLIEWGIISRRIEYEDKMIGYIYEGDEIIKDIKFYLWNVLYEERSIRKYEERLQRQK